MTTPLRHPTRTPRSDRPGRRLVTRSRRGSAYALVLITSALVSVIGLSAIGVVRIQRRSAEDSADIAQARLNAEAAIEFGMLAMQAKSWRSTKANGTWEAGRKFHDGEFTLDVTDPLDGDLADDPLEPVRILGTGACGAARFKLEVMLEPELTPLDALRTCLHAGGDLTIGLLHVVTAGGGPLSTNGKLNNSGTVTGDVEAVQVTSAGVIVGALTTPAPAKTMPGATALSYYRGIATPLGAAGTIEHVAIGAADNPLGAENADGVYYIDGGSGDVTLRELRLVGTLVVDLANKKQLRIIDTVRLEPHRADYPVLIVNGELVLDFSGSALSVLSESSASTNFNPIGIPYAGVTDVDTGDSYPSTIQGLVYVTGNATFSTTASVNGTVICGGNATLSGTHTLTHDSTLYDNPPAEFRESATMKVTPGSWSQKVD
ncbi:hypothetical protein RAS1_38560 [Phycisphaerae bacterium RAS1]|nr:hypothetical protein RAS1_38560 [Phycisphaerae bacterium RAS1]